MKKAKARRKHTRPIFLTEEAIADLDRSGLDPGDASIMGLTCFDAKATSGLTQGRWKSRPSYRIPYLDLHAKPDGFYRLKFLGDASVGEASLDAPKYWQPPKTPVRLYLPPWIDWLKVRDDPTQPLYLVEGEKKAAAGCKILGLPFAGLGGIWSWGSRKQGFTIVPDLVPFLVQGRKVVVVFDADPGSNMDVSAARDALAQEVWRRGGNPRIINLPASPDGKVGLDDFLVAKGPKAFQELAEQPTEYAAALAEANAELCYLEEQHAIYHLKTKALFAKPQQLTGLSYAHRKVLTYGRDGQVKESNLVAEWLAWAGRRSHRAIAYEPGKDPVTADNKLNVWAGWGIKPKKGDVSLFTRLLDGIFDGTPKDNRKWFTQWLAYPLQHPGAKLFQSCVLFSREHGTGKTLMGYTMGRIYGENYTVLSAENLHSQFNTWARHKQFVLGEELTGSERRADAERLKLLVTQETVSINAKFQPTYELPDRCNYLLTTNHADALNLDKYDRRFFVHEIVADKLPQAFFDKYNDWYRGDGAASVFHWLLQVNLEGFQPRGPAPMTEAKVEMQGLADQPVDYIIRDLVEAPDRVLSLNGSVVARDLFAPSELVALLDGDGKRHLNELNVAKALRRAGIRTLPLTRTAVGNRRLYALRNQDKWLKASHAERATHYDGKEKGK